MRSAILLLFVAFHSSLCAHVDLSSYVYCIKVLDGNYQLAWNITSDRIYFAARVKTAGWAGLGISPSSMANQMMPNSDVVIGWGDRAGEFTVS